MKYGAITIDALGNILGTIISTGPDSIVLSESTLSIDMEDKVNQELLQIHDLGMAYVYDLTAKKIIAKKVQTTSVNKTNLIADGVDVINITDVSNGTFTATNTTTNETITGSIEGMDTFATTIAGTYKIIVDAFSYLPFETTITAV